jgi:hypothetical protein
MRILVTAGVHRGAGGADQAGCPRNRPIEDGARVKATRLTGTPEKGMLRTPEMFERLRDAGVSV